MPRRQILTNEEKVSLLAIPDDNIILTRISYLGEQDIALINKHRKAANRFGFAVLLCYLRSVGFPPDKDRAPHDGILSRVSIRLKLPSKLWDEYAAREATRWEHLAELYRYLNLSPFNQAKQQACIQELLPHAMRTDRALLLAEEMMTWLSRNQVVFPSVEVIERANCRGDHSCRQRSVFSSCFSFNSATPGSTGCVIAYRGWAAFKACMVIATTRKKYRERCPPAHRAA